MKTWFGSAAGAMMLSAVALLIELFRAFIDFAFILPSELARTTETLSLTALVYVLLFAGWGGGLLAAQKGRRAGFIAALAAGAFFWLTIDLGSILFYCPGGCSRYVLTWASWLGLTVGALAGIALALQLRPKPQRAEA